MEYFYKVGEKAAFCGQEAKVLKTGVTSAAEPKYYCEVGPASLPMWVPESHLSARSGDAVAVFNTRRPHVLVVDGFYKNPDAIRSIALEQEYEANNKIYKGKRTKENFLFPYVREEFERLLHGTITDWLNQPANGCFQITGFDDPLVYHSDSQTYADAVYLTPDAPISAGTSFWRNKDTHCRRPVDHPLEYERFSDDDARKKAYDETYSEFNITHQDNWELVDKVGPVYNRLTLWDAKLIHSASSYEGLESGDASKARLVQLFFFNIQ